MVRYVLWKKLLQVTLTAKLSKAIDANSALKVLFSINSEYASLSTLHVSTTTHRMAPVLLATLATR